LQRRHLKVPHIQLSTNLGELLKPNTRPTIKGRLGGEAP